MLEFAISHIEMKRKERTSESRRGYPPQQRASIVLSRAVLEDEDDDEIGLSAVGMIAGYILNDFPSAMPARRNPDTIFPTPAERRQDQTKAQALNAEQWAENTSLTLPFKQLCYELKTFRNNLFKTLTPELELEEAPSVPSAPPRPEPQRILRRHQQPPPHDEEILPPPRTLRRQPEQATGISETETETKNDAGDASDSDVGSFIRVQQPQLRRPPRALRAPQQGIYATSADPFRLCINYIYLNSISEKGVGQLKFLKEVLQTLAGRRVYSVVDGFSEYFYIPMEEESIYLTAFVVLGLEFIVFPHYRRANTSINPRKSPLLIRTQKLLGHIVSKKGLSKSPKLVDKFSTLFWKPVTGPEDVERNQAAIQWMAKFIPSLSDKTKFMSEKL
ncbi:hypothetical protein BDZ91DRAFT_767844 [Kalaharituber pfeilii]|nr:hypothetical protein BDZ91DRAFT_767844 [Kalaharituber pfeilii]